MTEKQINVDYMARVEGEGATTSALLVLLVLLVSTTSAY